MKNLARLTIFTGSFLSFFVQPLVGKTLLPYFGGSSTVWIACLVAFQVLLLIGYGYAFIPARKGWKIHGLFIAVAAVLAMTFPLWKDIVLASFRSLPPVAGVPLAVLSTIGLASVVLSANSTVVQSWVGGNREVYRLYSIGNAGSFLGLLAYPVVVEPFVGLTLQWLGMGLALLAYLGFLLALRFSIVSDKCGGCITQETASAADAAVKPKETIPASPWLWIALPAVSCALMTATTTFLTSDFMPLPLMWALLLAAFLLSYVIGFSKIGERLLGLWIALSIASLGLSVWAMLPKENDLVRFYYNAGAAASLLLIVCTALHSWLCRIRPDVERIPHFYFSIALGGCIGGIAAGIVAPLVFDWVWEYPLTIGVTLALFALLLWSWWIDEYCLLNKIALGLLGVIALVLLIGRADSDACTGTRIYRERGFYGICTVTTQNVPYPYDGSDGEHPLHTFLHGKVAHGLQMREVKPEAEMMPRAYYSLNGGSIPFEDFHRKNTNAHLRAACIGMGIGSLAGCARAGDYLRFYEISPEVIRLAWKSEYFSFLSGCAGKVDVIQGDARLELEKDLAAGVEPFDIIVVDAYSGDSIPTHLITAEAFDLYRKLLKDDGVLACHVSNWHMDLWPVMKAAAKHLGLRPLGSFSGYVYSEFAYGTAWVFMTKDEYHPRMPQNCSIVDWEKVKDIPLITDDCGSLVFNIRFNYQPPYKDEP